MTANYNSDFEQLTGLERLRHFERNTEQRFGVARMLGYEIRRIDSGQVELQFEPKEEHLNLFSTVHGGILASLLDTGMGCALMTLLEAGEHHTIVDLHAKYLRPVTLQKSPLIVRCEVEHRGKRQCTMSGDVVCPDGKLCATATATAMIL